MMTVHQRSGSSMLMGATLVDFWHVTEFFSNSREYNVLILYTNGLVSYCSNAVNV